MKKTFGKIPIYKGDWAEGVTVKEKFRFTYKGSEFQALRDDLTTPPLDNDYNLNEGWIYISNGTDAYRAAEKIANNAAEIEKLKEVDESLKSDITSVDEKLTEHIDYANSKFDHINDTLSSQEDADVVHDTRILELEKAQWPLMLTLDLTPSLLEYTGVLQVVSAKYTVKHKGALKLPNTLKLTQDGAVVTTDPAKEDTAAITVNKLGNTTIQLSATAHSYYGYHSEKEDDIISATISKTIQMVLPIYAGFGTSAESVKTDSNKLSVRTSAAGTYTKTCQSDNQNFYILVPRTFATLTSFTMGGAPFVMETSDITLGGYEYKQYKSGAVYNTGATVNIKAS